ncbi:TetR/AcrR family transcriptional regulator [Winogradskyella forsetii]|uniref:TetR/AcrR family transcriptional regulator n=1 Tax=Winogradskyella forsetii TaxID=2686077 RepID=UPI0015BC5B17|nr:TetR/AcrR family transcriptional regulator [Winogradskyella forsetii]
MIKRSELIKYAVSNFTKFGSKRITMDDLAKALGISKKTIYNYFESKEHLVIASVSYLIANLKQAVDKILNNDNYDAITKIILIYKIGFERLNDFKPSFIFGLKKYYPKANDVFDAFRYEIVNETIYGLLKEARTKGLIKPQVSLQLFCNLYFKRFEEVALRNNNLIENYSNEELLNHFVVYSLRGIAVSNYKNTYFE